MLSDSDTFILFSDSDTFILFNGRTNGLMLQLITEMPLKQFLFKVVKQLMSGSFSIRKQSTNINMSC